MMPEDDTKQTDWQIQEIWAKLRQHSQELAGLAKEQIALIAEVDMLLRHLDLPKAMVEPDVISEAQIELISKLIRKHKPDGTQYASLAEFEADMSAKHGKPFTVATLTKAQGVKLIESLVTRVGELREEEKQHPSPNATWEDVTDTLGVEQPEDKA